MLFLVFLLVIAVFTDWKQGKIPNWLILTGVVAGIIITKELYQSILQAFFVIIAFFPFFLLKALGAGDIKCIAMSALYLTSEQLLQTVLYTFLIAAVMSVFKVFWFWFISKETGSLRCLTIHLAFPVFLGVLISTGGDLLCIIS